MENTNPNKILKKTIDLLELLPQFGQHHDNFSIIVQYKNLTNNLLNISIEYVNYSFIVNNNKVYSKIGLLNIINIFKKNMSIYNIDFNSPEHANNLFYCNTSDCLKNKKIASIKLQQSFRRSREYAAWNGSPKRLEKQGYFNLKV